MRLSTTVIGLTLFAVALASQFLSDAAKDDRRKMLWRRVMQVAYLALLLFFAIQFYPIASKLLMTP